MPMWHIIQVLSCFLAPLLHIPRCTYTANFALATMWYYFNFTTNLAGKQAESRLFLSAETKLLYFFINYFSYIFRVQFCKTFPVFILVKKYSFQYIIFYILKYTQASPPMP